MDTSDLSALATHAEWADATIWNTALAAPVAREDEALHTTFHHMHLVQHLFVQGWERQTPVIRERSEFPSASELVAWGRAAHRRIADFLSRVPEPDWVGTFREPWTEQFEAHVKRSAAPHTLGESVLQVVMHSAHHRGQICRRLRELGLEPPTVDFIVWLWSGRPAARDATA